MNQKDESKVVTGTVEIISPVYPDIEQYEFIWDIVKNNPDPVQKIIF